MSGGGPRGINYGSATPEQIAASLQALRERVEANADEDVLIAYPRRLFLQSSSGTWYEITVDDEDGLTATEASISPL